MAAVAALDHRSTSAVSVDIDPGWYEGQLETADAAEAGQLLSPTAHAEAPVGAGFQQASSAQPAAATAAAPAPAAAASGSHVPTVLTKLQKWGDYQSFGEPVFPTRFIPMKTPLSHEILENWQLPEAPKHRLTVSTLLEAQHAAGRRVGLLLDLANHDCLYDCDIPSDVEYLHVQLVAKELPPLEFVREVARAANSFWARHPDQYIAIHCAYGFNRTGFVVCSYLIEHCGLTVDQALQSFAASRPPGVKHEKFRQELRARYGSGGSGSSSSSSSAMAAPMPVPAAAALLAGEASHSGSVSIPHPQLTAGLAASPAGVGCGSSRALSCRSCGSSSSTAATGWLAGGSPDVMSGGGRLMASSPGAAGSPLVQSRGAACMAPAGPDCPRCSWCNAELSTEDAAAAAAAAAAACGSSHHAVTPQRSLPPGFSSSGDADSTSASTSSCFAAASSIVACQTPPPYPLPPGLLPRSSSRGVLLSSSPATTLRASNGCWSSNSVGDNSSIGCSPSSSAADLITLRTSGLVSTRSSGLDSSTGGAPDTPGNAAQCAGAAEGAGSFEDRGGVGTGMLSQQWLGCAEPPGPSSACRGSSGLRQRHGSGSGEYAGCVFLYGRSSGGGGCSSGGAADGQHCDGDGDDPVEGSGAEEGCFEMDPYTDPLSPAGSQEQQQQQQQGGLSSRAGFSGLRQKSVKFQDAAVACCEQPAPGCSAADVQQLRGADLDSLLAAVSIRHQQQQVVEQPHLSPPAAPPLMQLQQGPLAAACSCDCHSGQPPTALPSSKMQGPGHSIRDGEACAAGNGSRQLFREQRGPGSPRLQRGPYSSEDGVCDPLENESFGRVTSADLLKNLRTLQRAHEAN